MAVPIDIKIREKLKARDPEFTIPGSAEPPLSNRFDPTRDGKVLVVYGCRHRRIRQTIFGWAMVERSKAELAIEAVNMATWHGRPERGFIHHSDHGAQYTSLTYDKTLREASVVGLMGAVGDALDNVVAESFLEAFGNRRRHHSAQCYRTHVNPKEGGILRKLPSA